MYINKAVMFAKDLQPVTKEKLKEIILEKAKEK